MSDGVRSILPVVDKNDITTQKTATIAGAALAAGLVGGAVIHAAVSRKKSRKRSKNTSSKRSRKRKHHSSGRKTPRTAGKGRDRSSRRIRYTKKGQPYIIQASGKARFIKKSGAKRSHKQKGGRY